jgi:hypothetical protein
LLVALLPSVAKQSCFALKGGTAINLFVRDMPRLSVDIDLAYLPVEDRDTSLAAIDQALETIIADGLFISIGDMGHQQSQPIQSIEGFSGNYHLWRYR